MPSIGSDQMVGHVVLVGGDEFRPGCEEMDRAILALAGLQRPSLLVVPTAAAKQNPSRASSNGVGYFSALGAEASALMVLRPDDANDRRLISPVDAADIVYLTGGDPIHLLDTLAGSLLLGKVRRALERGAVLAGSSAGAMVLGSWLAFGGWRKALDVVRGVTVLPHHERSDPDETARSMAASLPTDVAVLGIDGRTCCLGGPDGWAVLGQGGVTVYKGCRWRRFTSGEELAL